ncbi:MAG: SRPBCC family protein [Flavobacteriaceae bacterium]|nr:SRPBCC family protein [Flavobacteriaceae bacterium]
MKYNVEITIDLPRDEVIKKMDSIENMKHWQRGLTSAEHISGTPGVIGAKMQLNYKFGKREMQLTETITKRELPREFHANYDTKGMHNIQQNFFEETPDGKTKWISKSEFIPTNFMMRIMVALMPGAFKKQSKKYMEDFKNFAENGTSVANA